MRACLRDSNFVQAHHIHHGMDCAYVKNKNKKIYIHRPCIAMHSAPHLMGTHCVSADFDSVI